MIRGGAWKRTILVDSDDPENGQKDNAVWVCNACWAVVRRLMYTCPQCGQMMVAEINPNGSATPMDDFAIQAGADDAKIE